MELVTSRALTPLAEQGQASRLPSLDGLRAVAVLIVVVGHYLVRHDHSTGFVNRLLTSGAALGVGLFFAISGFLITRLLLLERREVGRIHLWRFYARRALRLWPPLWVFVGVTAVLSLAGLANITLGDVLGALLFTTDYTGNSAAAHGQVLFHTWSLAVEEQFYLLWPAILIVVGATSSRKLLVVAVAGAPLVRVGCYVLIPAWRDAVDFQFHTRFDVLAAGCLLAAYWESPRLQDGLRRYRGRLTTACIVGIGLVEIVNASTTSRAFMLVAGYSIESLAFAGLVGLALTSERTAGGRLLNSRGLVQIGLMSYSLYLWQQLFVHDPFGIFKIGLVGVLAAFACAQLSWRLLERPLLPLRRRLHPRPG
jgi:peptidoglycan/LPS O-acetylase OafA/YrhL